ncbi:Uma2 family endonuclease [[Phormidium] sp. ETS-05]|uniref:Uma2 family endonuclease n=1 Tax=[Phormidium] sp. ETS-05 TaxID=222819 RepID=UPI0031FF276F
MMIIQGKPAYYGNRKDTITNPLVMIEFLSKSTPEYDPTNKFKSYRTIPGFREYILIDQYETYIEHFIKTEQNQWILIGEHETADAVLQLAAGEVSITLSDIYQRVTFE